MFDWLAPRPLAGPLFDLAAAEAAAMAGLSEEDKSALGRDLEARTRETLPQLYQQLPEQGQRLFSSMTQQRAAALISTAAASVDQLATVLRERRAEPARRLITLSSLLLLVRPDYAGLRPQADSPYWRLPRALVLLAAMDVLGGPWTFGDQTYTSDLAIENAATLLPPGPAQVVAQSVVSYRQLLAMSGLLNWVGWAIDPTLAAMVQSPLAAPASYGQSGPMWPGPGVQGGLGTYSGGGTTIIPGVGAMTPGGFVPLR